MNHTPTDPKGTLRIGADGWEIMPTLTDQECNQLRAMPVPFNDMLRETFRLGWDAAKEAAKRAKGKS